MLEPPYQRRWQRRAAVLLSIGLCSACTLDWVRATGLDRDTGLEDGGEAVSPVDPPGDQGTQGDMDASDDAGTPPSAQGPNETAGEAGLDSAATTQPQDAGVKGGTEASVADAAGNDAATRSPDAGADAGCGPCGENQVCEPSERTCHCAPKHINEGGRCVRNPCADHVCKESETCQASSGEPKCVCASGTKACDGSCVDMRRDRAHCQDCGHACAGALQCIDSACEQPVKQLILGEAQTCALRSGGTSGPRLSCWGAESWGLFRGIGSPTGGWDLPRDVLDVPEARLMVLSVYHRCVVPPGSDVVRCWGICNVECGVAQYTSETVFTDTPAENVIGLATASLIQGRGATCILSADGALRCMGFNPFVLDSVSHAEPVPITIHGEAPYFRDVQGGYEHLCGSVGQGAGSQRKAVCWGRNTWNQLGSHDAPLPGSEPTGAPPIFYVQEEGGGDLSTVVKTAVGRTRSCALLDNGSVFCWGDNGGGELGSGDTLPHVGAVMVKGVHKAVDIAVGGSHACAVETLGHEVKCWGHGASAGQGNRQGDVADGIYFSTAQPVPGLDATVTGAAVVEIRAGNAHTCVRLDTGAVLCWGPNGSGELGDGTAIERLAPTLVPTLL